MNPLYEVLLSRILEIWPDTVVEVKKTQTSLRSRYIFACISMVNKAAVRLTFSLPYRVESVRIVQASEPYPMRWTHHVIIRNALHIDDEIIGWLAAAREFAMNK